MKLKGIELKGTYKVEFGDTCFEVYNDKGYEIYFENSDGGWYKSEYDDKINVIYFVNSYGYWERSKYDEKGNQIYYEDSFGCWFKKEYDEKGNEIYHEDSDEKIIDNRVKELTIGEVEKVLGYKINMRGDKK